MKNLITILSVLLLFPLPVQARSGIVVELTIENQEVDGTDFLFDLYMTRHTSSSDNIYLIDSDFLLTFNAGFFTSPTLEKVSNGTDNTGFCAFVTTEGTQGSNQMARELYYGGTAATLMGGNLIIVNLESPLPSSQPNFDGTISRIDSAPSTHRLGRFRISGISNPAGTAGLKWVNSGTGLITKVFSFETASPWPSEQVEIVNTPPFDFPLDSVVVSSQELPLPAKKELKIYPNPSTSEITVEFHSARQGVTTVSFINESGMEIYKTKHLAVEGENRLRINVNAIPGGFYRVKMVAGNQVLAGNFLKP